jgi:hypothetical protein
MQYCFVQWKILDGMRRLVHYSQDNHPDLLSQDKFLPAAHKLPQDEVNFSKRPGRPLPLQQNPFYVKMPCPNYNNDWRIYHLQQFLFSNQIYIHLYYHNVVS